MLQSNNSTDIEQSPKKATKAPPIKRSSTQLTPDQSNARIIQSNLVYIINLPPTAASLELLQSPDYFGQYGIITKCVINKSPQHGAYQAYLTFLSDESASVCIKACNNYTLDSYELTATFGTTKYCNYFLKNNLCPKPECLYLHQIAKQSNIIPREIIPQTRHIQPENSVFDGLKVVICPPQGSVKLPIARVIRERERAYSEQLFDYPKQEKFKNRFGFVLEGDEPEIPGHLQELRKFFKTREEVTELPINLFNVIKDKLEDDDKWHSDILDMKVGEDKAVIFSKI